MTDFGSELILNSDVKYIGEGEDPAENPYMKAYAKALKQVYQPERSKREDLCYEHIEPCEINDYGLCPMCIQEDHEKGSM